MRCPLLICACDRENLIDPAIVTRVAADVPGAVIEHCDADHFTVYHPPVVEQIVADQIAFVTTHLAPAGDIRTSSRCWRWVSPRAGAPTW
ncbi:hypothetical protein [Nocardia asiatica]|uniref:hypothetical protein n=1 Tax=Nocardia asiatica TaxID=209252 RepID=UPI0024557AC3|nr:hypothetical protein [Nocardia asiatica]